MLASVDNNAPNMFLRYIVFVCMDFLAASMRPDMRVCILHTVDVPVNCTLHTVDVQQRTLLQHFYVQ